MAKYAPTPGPWKKHGSYIYAPDGAIIARVDNPGCRESDYPLVANRDLMAAAPELLAVLKEVVESDEVQWHDGPLWNAARAAIAQAEGE